MRSPEPAPHPLERALERPVDRPIDRPLRVGYVLTMFPRFSETFVLNELLALEQHGAELTVMSLRLPDDGRFHAAVADLRAPVHYLERGVRSSGVWTALARAQRVLPGLRDHLDALLALPVAEGAAALEAAVLAVENGLDHLHAHFANSPASVARVAAGLAGIGYSLTAHAKDIFHDDVDLDALRRNLGEAAATVTVSDFNVAHLRELHPRAAERVHRVYNGLDLDRFALAAAPRAERTVVAVGRLVPKKGFDVLVEAIAAMARSGDPVRARIVGAGAEQERLRALAERRGVAERIELVGPLPQDRMKQAVAAATVFAAPCVVAADGNRDGLPTVLLEALALGTPCVATPVTGIPEVIEDGVTGRLAPSGDPAALAAVLADLLDDAAQRDRLARAGRAVVEERFDVRANAARLLALFTALSGATVGAAA